MGASANKSAGVSGLRGGSSPTDRKALPSRMARSLRVAAAATSAARPPAEAPALLVARWRPPRSDSAEQSKVPSQTAAVVARPRATPLCATTARRPTASTARAPGAIFKASAARCGGGPLWGSSGRMTDIFNKQANWGGARTTQQ